MAPHLVEKNIVGAAERAAPLLQDFADSINLVESSGRDPFAVAERLTLICWPICWLMTTFTRAREAVTPSWEVISCSKVSEVTIFWMTGSHL